ncbi:hypothetical protein EXM65_18545 [Clostridium botulinum]|uniref:Uncharacterized protein n=1 Tax=Clostridium botulinum TaxID=1491 RepID=A0A6M0SXR7_CLOBO|nr:hypothetical protein [Clostridium sp. ZBS13]NFA44495.1 hypothetical protein [Clostridium botulinum]
MREYGISVTHKFITETKKFKRGVLYTKEQIINTVFNNGWDTPHLTKDENIKRICNAINHNCRKDVRRMKSINRRKYYIFL